MEAAVARGGREEAAEGPREHIVSTNGASAWIRVLHERLRAVLEANGRDAAVEALLAELAASGEDLQREYASAREETTKRLQDVRDHETLVNLQQGRLVEDWTRLRTENEEMAEANTALEARVKELETSERASVAQTKGLQTQMRLADGLMHDRAVRITALELKLSSAAATNPAATPEAKAAVDGQRVLIDDLGEDLLDDLMHADAGESDESDAILSLKEEAATLRKRLSEEEGRVTALQETAARHEDQLVGVVDSPRDDDPAALRRRLEKMRAVVASKDSEIEELHQMLAELRPKLEAEIKEQVARIMETANKKAEGVVEKARAEAKVFWQQSQGGFDAQQALLESCASTP
ncbi:hypothetical protein T484DRAFT_1810616 [Baffinella frigidus]|nr:hypothetical protein T484DRAFT_1810616 [Cryptophyta sp. CCMP2293]